MGDAMSVPYFVRIFRKTDDPAERKRIYKKVGPKLKTRLRKRFNLCIHCFSAPISSADNLCRDCGRPRSRRNCRRQRFKEAGEKLRLTPHQRVCIGCERLFESRRGLNVCQGCVQQVRVEVAARSLDRTSESIGSDTLVVALYRKFGNRYKSTVRPRIPLSTIGVFQAVGR
jgi:predicted amidophosphoribosyltransferase